MTEKMKKFELDLRDDALSGLLRDTYNNDEALQPAPERSERIMRHILAARANPAPVRGWQWPGFAWAGGALAMGGLAVAMFMATHVTTPTNMPIAAVAPKNSVTALAPAPVAVPTQEIVANVPQLPVVVAVEETTGYTVPAPQKSRTSKVLTKPTPENSNTNIASKTLSPVASNNTARLAVPTKDAFASTAGLAGMNEMANAYLASGDVEGALLAMEIKRGQDADPDTDLAIARLLIDNAEEMSL